MGRVVFSDPARNLEIYEYAAAPTDDLDVWFEHPGETVLHLIGGSLRIEFGSHPDVVLEAGDCVVHPGTIPHRWTVVGDEPIRLFLLVVRSDAAAQR